MLAAHSPSLEAPRGPDGAASNRRTAGPDLAQPLPARSRRRHPRSLDELEDDYFDLIVTLAPEAHHRALEMTRSMAVEVEYWPSADPTTVAGTREQILAAYRDVRDRLARRIGERFVNAAAARRRE